MRALAPALALAFAMIAGFALPAAALSKIEKEPEAILKLLEAAPTTAYGKGGKVLYVLGFIGCPNCAVFRKTTQDRLVEKGVEVRWLIYPVGTGQTQKDLAADIAIKRDPAHLDAAEKPGFKAPPADTDERKAAVERVVATMQELATRFADNGEEVNAPFFIWKDGATLMATGGFDPMGFLLVEAPLTAK